MNTLLRQHSCVSLYSHSTRVVPHTPTHVPRHRSHRCSSTPDREQPTCSDLQGMVDSVQFQQEQQQTSSPAPPQPTTQQQQQQQQQQPPIPSQPAVAEKKQYDASYYAGFLTTDIKETNQADVNENLIRNLKLAGGLAGVLVFLFVGFMASNGLL